MKVLVTGANGRLGRECMRLFGDCAVAAGLPALDVSDYGAVSACLGRICPDAVINCAAWTDVDGAENHPEEAFLANTTGPGNLARALSGSKAMLVHISTDYVFDGKKPLFSPYAEDDAPCPLSVYGKSKLAGEEHVLGYGNGAVLRTAWLYGRDGKNFVRTIFGALKAGEKPRVVDDRFGTPTRASSLARQISLLLESFRPGLYHASGGGHASWHGFASKIASLAFPGAAIEAVPSPGRKAKAQRPVNSILENRELKRMGIDIMPAWEEDLESFAKEVFPVWLREDGGI